MVKSKNANERIKTTFANSGRMAGSGISEDDYSDRYVSPNYRPQPKFNHREKIEHGEVIVMKASEVLGGRLYECNDKEN